ncbi:hypothetical protein J2W51_000121 [Tardiphaga robiniae]|uniref:hypothetical protein n=1 Tax=Tardiphaga robiniae TaxID=943830 RepID=UPI0028582691|nr:hypothetical protein [Tardiphaga robiniae]MDR6657579.1 hypothetical protein [Tardiphaga robiniae]
MKNWSDLRDFETQVRTEIKKNMGTRPSANGDDSRKAIETVTKGRYTLDLKDNAIDPVAFHKKIVEVTGVSNRSSFDNIPSFLAGVIVKDIIISSALKIEGKPYGEGHQFAILGVSSPDPNSNVEYLVLNSGARRKTPTEKQIDVCEVGVPDDKSPYFASLGWSKNINFNAPAGKMRAWRLVKK